MAYLLKGWLLSRHSHSCYASCANRCLTRPVSTDIVTIEVETKAGRYNQERVSSKHCVIGKRISNNKQSNQWLEHLWDHRNLLGAWVNRATEG